MLSNSIARKLGGLMAIAFLLTDFVPCEGAFRRRRQDGAIQESGTGTAAATGTTSSTGTGTTAPTGTGSSSSTDPDRAVCHGNDLVGYLNSDGAFYLPTENPQKDAKGSCVCGLGLPTSDSGAPLLRCPDTPTNFPPSPTNGTTTYECSKTSDCPAKP